MNDRLIFDIGLHKGYDSNFYLRKGFKVVGLEAVPALCKHSAEINQDFVASGDLIIVEKALYHHSNETVTFYSNPGKDDWGSLFKTAAEKGLGGSVQISVRTITLTDLIEQYGVPYYAKCDIESGDALFAEQLTKLNEHPMFVSLEATQADDIAMLRSCGYDRFQLINQYANPFTTAPNPSREGAYLDITFTHEMSGLFGRDLDPARWVDFTQTMRMFLDWYDLRDRNTNLALGWLDVHACKSTSPALLRPD